MSKKIAKQLRESKLAFKQVTTAVYIVQNGTMAVFVALLA